MNAWLIANLGISFSDWIATILAIGGAFSGLAKLRNSKASNAIRDLRASLDLCKDQKEKAEAERDEAKKQHADVTMKLQQCLMDNNEGLGSIDILHAKISSMESLMAERPSLIAWGPTLYREAFPVDPEHPVFYCAVCWKERRLVTPRQLSGGGIESCKFWREDWHKDVQPDYRLGTGPD